MPTPKKDKSKDTKKRPTPLVPKTALKQNGNKYCRGGKLKK